MKNAVDSRHRCGPRRPRAASTAQRFRSLLLLGALAVASPSEAQTPDLTSLSLEQLLDIAVVGASKYEQKQSDVAAAVSVITRQEIRAFGWQTLDDALASLPGVYTTYDRQYTYFGARGFGLPGDFNTRVLVTINGNRLNDPTFDGGPFGRQFPLDMDLIERIEYIPGPGGAVYGQNAMFAVVNVVTRDGADVHGVELSASVQSPQTRREGRVTWGQKFASGVDVLVSASGLGTRGEDRFFDFGEAGIAGVAAGLDGARGVQFFGRAARGAWSFEHVHGDRRKDDPTGAYFSDPLVPGQYQRDVYTVTQLQYQDGLVDDTLQVSARLFAGRERYTSELSYDTVFSFPASSNWRGGEARLLSTAFARHKLMLGVEGQQNFRVDQAINDLAEPANDLHISSPGYRVGVYAQDELRISNALAATLGLRIDRNDATGAKTSPRAGVIWQVRTGTTAKALYGRAHRAPNAYERDYDDGIAQVGNPMLEGERVDTAEVVVDHRIGSDLRLRGALYQWDIHDIIALGVDPTSGLPQYQSGTLVKARGMEVSADKTWGAGARLRGSVSAQDVAYEDGGQLLNSPRWLGKLNLSAPLPWAGLRAGYEVRYDSKRLSLDGTDLSGYVLSNLQVATGALVKGLDVSLGIYNLFDERYMQPGSDSNWQNALEQDGRSVRVKISLGF